MKRTQILFKTKVQANWSAERIMEAFIKIVPKASEMGSAGKASWWIIFDGIVTNTKEEPSSSIS